MTKMACGIFHVDWHVVRYYFSTSLLSLRIPRPKQTNTQRNWTPTQKIFACMKFPRELTLTEHFPRTSKLTYKASISRANNLSHRVSIGFSHLMRTFWLNKKKEVRKARFHSVVPSFPDRSVSPSFLKLCREHCLCRVFFSLRGHFQTGPRRFDG